MKEQIIEILKRFRIKSLEEDGTISISQLIYQSDFDKVAEEIEKLYQQEYLNTCIEKAQPNLSKIKDVDKKLAEIRGIDELAEKIANTDYMDTEQTCDNCIWGKCLTAGWPCFDCDGSNKWEPIKTE